MKDMCAPAGVAVVFVPELPKLRVCGAARWLSADKALIQLSLFYKRDDQFWFSFFHEAGHILLHGKREVFVDTVEERHDSEEEEANGFAADFLIPPEQYIEFIAQGEFTYASIIAFASALGIAPGIVVGRLQHERKIGFNERNELRRGLRWVEETESAA
jgi:HTH-type transcriptional regulator / antitoxin HigA